MIFIYEQECIPVGCVPSTAMAAGGGVDPSMHWAGGVFQHALGRVCVSQHALGRGVCVSPYALGRGCLLQCMLGYTSLWTEFLKHACENITCVADGK